MRVIIGDGKVSKIIRHPGDLVLSHSHIEISDIDSVRSTFKSLPQNTAIINTAAKINLEWCESNKLQSYKVNTLGALNVAQVCLENGFHYIHIGSGCIFDGGNTGNIYDETSIASPACWYALTKAQADNLIVKLGLEKFTIVRPRQLFSRYIYPTNIFTKFSGMGSGKFINSLNSASCIEDLSLFIDHIIDHSLYGIYNFANDGYTTPFEMALLVKNYLNPSLIVEGCEYDEYLKTINVKRVNTLLNIDKMQSSGFKVRPLKVALLDCLENYQELP